MTTRRIKPIATRREPQQARSTDLVAAILQAAVQVLTKEGVRRFTTTRVAERAGVSVGSVYQYFPNKASILFRLQSDEWRQTTGMLRAILEGGGEPPFARLRALVHAFIRSECDEAELRTALADAAPFYRDTPEAQEARATGRKIVRNFMREALPACPASVHAAAGDLVTMTLGAVGQEFSETSRKPSEIKAFADSLADMFCAYLQGLARPAAR